MLQKKPEQQKDKMPDGCVGWCMRVAATFLPPWTTMLGLSQVDGWHWSYWHTFYVWNAVYLALGWLAYGVTTAIGTGRSAFRDTASK